MNREQAELSKGIAQAGIGMIPVVGVGAQAAWETEDSVSKLKDNPYYDPTQARIVAGIRGIAGAGTDILSGGLAKILNLAGIGGLGLGASGVGTTLAGHSDLGRTLAEGADYLNPDSYIKKGLYSLMPGADPGLAEAKLEAQKQQVAKAYDNITTSSGNTLNDLVGLPGSPNKSIPAAETAPTLTQSNPTEQAAIQKADQNISTSPRNTAMVRFNVTPDNIDHLIAGSEELKKQLQAHRVSASFNLG